MEQDQANKCCCKSSLSVCGVTIAAGVTWGLAMLVTGLLATYFDMGKPFVDLFGSIYKGFTPTLLGSFIGAGWGFLDGLVCGFVFALIYKCVSHCRPCRGCKGARCAKCHPE